MINPQSFALDLITFEKSPYMNDLRTTVPRLKVHVPYFGLPKWKYLPLESKIPMIPGLQERMYAFTRNKLGKPLRIRFAVNQPFDMSDPFNNEVQMPYAAMHDVHLAHYFRNSVHVQEGLIKMGLISPQLDVKCNLKEYNNYRNYLRVVYAKSIRNEVEKRDKIIREKKIINDSQIIILKKLERLKKEEIRENLLKELNIKQEMKLKEIFRKHKEIDQRIENINKMRYQITQKKIMESKKRYDYIQNKKNIIAEKAEQKILNTLNKWHERDNLLRKSKEQNLLKKRYDKITASFNKFELKKTAQRDEIEKQFCIKQCAEKIKELFLTKYKKKLDYNQKKLEELLLLKKEAVRKSLEPKKKKNNCNKKNICRCKIVKN